jgi:hypothetical protein
MSNQKRLVTIGLVAAAALGLVQFLVPGGWGWVFMPFRRAASAAGAWAASLVSVPVWLLCIVTALTVAAVCAVAFVAWTRLRKRAVEIAPLTTAEIFGIRWRWNYDEGEIRDITSYCPKCDLEVQPTNETRHGFLHLISYQCRCRKWQSKSFQCSQDDMIDRVYHTIKQQIRKRAAAVEPTRCVAR